ncbi:diguanylate cyclase regulator RdcB family protein [Pseudomonas gingeri]|uniref:diguanylate cyclase regulator RdcB family protein n=1 Tax=Pseudomonas gingeri TaxID=117681 RepID=UPI0015A30DCD|nr:diguanylate cyclase regulator RdcB family protein [Pseudomonas gingeri]NWA05399.1 hypothetical protein [Pseudomonas gingeri]NWA17822.1 hypothetical protein [Pseudomonas gingeri]NWA57786.1 hypothetical protein [Pseudomonas gingeri]NWA98807.1 hypothetical protein [Pseudomonas gingeri]NWB05933.1 hypothetical protein [Pseudomonas gingeri]
MNRAEPLPQSSELCQLLTSLPEKFVVDFANGIDVGREHLRVSTKRTDFFLRLYDGFTGQGSKRQAEINASLFDGIEGALHWLTDLSTSLTLSNHTIAQLQKRVSDLKRNTARLADYSVQTRLALDTLSEELSDRCHALESQVERIDRLQQAHLHLDQVFGKWGAGRLDALSLSGRCYAALEELRWGPFGSCCAVQDGSERQQLLEMLADRAIIQLARDAQVARTERRSTVRYWMLQSTPAGVGIAGDTGDAIRYLGDWADPLLSPFVYAISGQSETLPLHLPRLGSAQRVAEGMIGEVFMGHGQ